MNAKAYRIEAISNLHVGGMGDAISIVDLPVQRDVLTGYPTIHASSLKGALRKRCESTAEIWDEIDTIFGGRHDVLNPTQG